MTVNKSCLDCAYGFKHPVWLDIVENKNYPAIELGAVCRWEESLRPHWVSIQRIDEDHPFINCRGYRRIIDRPVRKGRQVDG